MFKTISTAIVATFVITSSASACGFLCKLAHGGKTPEQWESQQIERAQESGEVVYNSGDSIWVTVEGVTTRIKKNDLRGSKDQKVAYIKERVKEEVILSSLEAQGVDVSTIDLNSSLTEEQANALADAGQTDFVEIGDELFSANADSSVLEAALEAAENVSDHALIDDLLGSGLNEVSDSDCINNCHIVNVDGEDRFFSED